MTSQPSNFAKQIVVVASFLLLAGLGVWFYRSRPYESMSGDGYEITKAIYAACNLQDDRRLASVRETFAAADLPEGERRLIGDIITMIDDGHWEAAAARSRTILSDQLK